MDKRLSEIKVGKAVIIKAFEKDDIFLKLMEMGCVPGETIIVDQVAPLGDPISILVAGYNLSLRLSEANNIWVEDAVVAPKLKSLIALQYIMKIGLYFGSFNPIHIGHLIIANHVASSTDLQQVWF